MATNIGDMAWVVRDDGSLRATSGTGGDAITLTLTGQRPGTDDTIRLVATRFDHPIHTAEHGDLAAALDDVERVLLRAEEEDRRLADEAEARRAAAVERFISDLITPAGGQHGAAAAEPQEDDAAKAGFPAEATSAYVPSPAIETAWVAAAEAWSGRPWGRDRLGDDLAVLALIERVVSDGMTGQDRAFLSALAAAARGELEAGGFLAPGAAPSPEAAGVPS